MAHELCKKKKKKKNNNKKKNKKKNNVFYQHFILYSFSEPLPFIIKWV